MTNAEEYPQLTTEMLEMVTRHFINNGIRGVDMEDIAKLLGITKKYLYQLVSTKGELVAKCSHFIIHYFTKNYSEFSKQGKDPIHEFYLVNDFICDDYSGLNPDSYKELKNYYPTAFKIYSDFHYEFNNTFITANLKEGVKQGIYRENVNVPLMVRLYLNTTLNLLNDEDYPFDQFNYVESRTEFVKTYLLGLVTEKGKDLYDKYFK